MSMLAKWEVKEIITQALEALDGMLSEPDYEIGKCVPSRKIFNTESGR